QHVAAVDDGLRTGHRGEGDPVADQPEIPDLVVGEQHTAHMKSHAHSPTRSALLGDEQVVPPSGQGRPRPPGPPTSHAVTDARQRGPLSPPLPSLLKSIFGSLKPGGRPWPPARSFGSIPGGSCGMPPGKPPGSPAPAPVRGRPPPLVPL